MFVCCKCGLNLDPDFEFLCLLLSRVCPFKDLDLLYCLSHAAFVSTDVGLHVQEISVRCDGAAQLVLNV